MMRKLNYLMIGAAGMLLASCASEDLQGPATNDGNVSITVNLPGDAMSTRADFGSGTASKVLKYAVYDMTNASQPTLAFTGDANFGASTSTTLSLNLLDKNYKIAFFAQSAASNEEGVYSLDTSGTSPILKVNYLAMTSATNVADGYDCFYNVETVDLSETNAPTSFNVTLYRPVAQVNWGANDINGNKQIGETFGETGQYIQTSLEVSDMPTQLDLFAGTTSGTFSGTIGGEDALFAKPDGVYPVNSPTNQYVAIQYFLVGAPKEITGNDAAGGTYDFTLNIENSGNNNNTQSYTTNVIVTNAPLKANYQTNIYGTLLSNSTSFDIEVSPGFAGSEESPLVWDGETVTYPSTINGKVAINRASDLAGLAEMVNGTGGSDTPNDFEGQTIVLNADFDMGGNELSLGSASRDGKDPNSDSNAFRGTFDGQGHTISGITISYEGDNSVADDNTALGFIPNLDGTGVLKNVTFSDFVIEGSTAQQVGVVGLVSGGATVSNVTIESGTITAAEGAGLVGRVLKNGTIDHCENNADIIVTSKNGAGIAGAAYYSESDGCYITISNCTNNGNIACSSSGTGNTIGGIVGTSSANIIGCVNTGNVGQANVSAPAGGIVGYQNSCGSIKNCTNEGTIAGTAEAAGIVAFIGAIPYDYKEIIELSGNVNKGAVNGTGTAGGILGINRNTVNIINNTNSGNVNGGDAAGIVGSGFKQDNPISGGNGYCNLSGNNVNSGVISGTKTGDIYTGEVYINGVLQPKI